MKLKIHNLFNATQLILESFRKNKDFWTNYCMAILHAVGAFALFIIVAGKLSFVYIAAFFIIKHLIINERLSWQAARKYIRA
jgi:hypothetical protein